MAAAAHSHRCFHFCLIRDLLPGLCGQERSLCCCCLQVSEFKQATWTYIMQQGKLMHRQSEDWLCCAKENRSTWQYLHQRLSFNGCAASVFVFVQSCRSQSTGKFWYETECVDICVEMAEPHSLHHQFHELQSKWKNEFLFSIHKINDGYIHYQLILWLIF